MDRTILGLVRAALLVVEPSELLQNLGVVGGVVKNTLVGSLGIVELERENSLLEKCSGIVWRRKAYVFLLLVNMTNLEPDVFLGQRPRGRVDNVLEALHIVSL